MLPAGILVAALFAMLVFAPLASATPDPVESSTTSVKINLDGKWTKYLKTFGIKIQKVGSTKVKGNQATFKVGEGSMDPTNGLGNLNLAGGLQFKAGKKKAPVKGMVLDTAHSKLTGKISGKKYTLASAKGLAYSRNGFGVNVTVKKLKLTNAAANALNKKTGYAKGKPKPFLKNKLIGKSSSKVQPATVAVTATGLMNLATDPTTIGKLKEVGVTIPVTAPTTEPSAGVYAFPISGGALSPAGTAGTAQSAGGLQLLQKFEVEPGKFIETEITLANIWADLGAKTLNVEVIGRSTASKDLDLGNLGRSSIADLTVSGLVADPATRTISVTGNATLQPISAEVLNGFVAVYKGAVEAASYQGYCENPLASPLGCTETSEKEAAKAFAKAKGEEETKGKSLAAGNPLGVVSFTAQTQ